MYRNEWVEVQEDCFFAENGQKVQMLGLFAATKIPRFTVLGEYRGDVITEAEYRARAAQIKAFTKGRLSGTEYGVEHTLRKDEEIWKRSGSGKPPACCRSSHSSSFGCWTATRSCKSSSSGPWKRGRPRWSCSFPPWRASAARPARSCRRTARPKRRGNGGGGKCATPKTWI